MANSGICQHTHSSMCRLHGNPYWMAEHNQIYLSAHFASTPSEMMTRARNSIQREKQKTKRENAQKNLELCFNITKYPGNYLKCMIKKCSMLENDLESDLRMFDFLSHSFWYQSYLTVKPLWKQTLLCHKFLLVVRFACFRSKIT